MTNSLTLASYNIRKCVGLDWRRDPQRIVDIILELNADVILLQEADKRMGERPGTLPIAQLEELGYRFAPVAENSVGHGSHGNAILYRSSLKLKTAHCIELPYYEPRGAVSAVLQNEEGASFECIGVHLGLGLKSRRKQLAALRDYVETREVLHPTILAGDFNEWRKTQKLEAEFGTDYRVLSPGPSFHSAMPKLALDYFILWGDVSAKTHGRVHLSKLSRKGSDHLPIVLEVSIPALEPVLDKVQIGYSIEL